MAPWAIEAQLRLDAPIDVVQRRFPPTTAVVEPDPEGDPTKTVVRTGANELGPLVAFVMAMPFGVEVLAPTELREAIRARLLLLAASNP